MQRTELRKELKELRDKGEDAKIVKNKIILRRKPKYLSLNTR